MKIKSGELLKKLRAEMGLSQEDMAEKAHISERQLRRYEANEVEMDVWLFMQLFELLGLPTEDFWLLYLDTKDFESYRAYRHLKRLVRDKKYAEIRNILPAFEEQEIASQPLVRQFIAAVKIKIDTEIKNEDAVEKLLEAIRMSNPKFDESKVSEYRLTYNEISIIVSLAGKLFNMKEIDRAISITQETIAGRENFRTSEEDVAILFPPLMSSLSTMLGSVGRYKECLAVCDRTMEICRDYSKFRYIPVILHNKASCHMHLGEEEAIYKPHLLRAYHSAYAMGLTKTAQTIKKCAERDFGITSMY